MKYLTLLLTPIFVFASGQTLTPSEHNSIHGYNNNPMLKMAKKQKMHKLHKIDEKEASKIVFDKTNEQINSIKLLHKGNILHYRIDTKNHIFYINALSKEILKRFYK